MANEANQSRAEADKVEANQAKEAKQVQETAAQMQAGAGVVRPADVKTDGERRAEAAANEPKEVSPLAGVLQHEPAGDAAVNLAPAQPSELPQATIDEMNAGKDALARNKPKAG